jgi:hypothetical protein
VAIDIAVGGGVCGQRVYYTDSSESARKLYEEDCARYIRGDQPISMGGGETIAWTLGKHPWQRHPFVKDGPSLDERLKKEIEDMFKGSR